MTVVNPTLPGLIADIGGTNVRFALCTPGGEPYSPMTLHCVDHPDLLDAARTYLQRAAAAVLPKTGAFAVASPVGGDMVTMTNHPWRFSIDATRKELGLNSLRVVNDFVAIALCVPRLTAAHRIRIGAGLPSREAPIGILGPGTGLGVGLLVPFEGRWHAIPTEGGHVTMAPYDDEESEILSILRQRFGHVSAERILSGPGLVNLYQAIGALDDEDPAPIDPAVITERALSGADRLSVKTLRMFLAMLGTVAGNLALTGGCTGGVYIAGGIVPKILSVIEGSPFRFRFEEKGRFRDYNGRVPTYVITHPYPAFLGLSGLLAV